MIWSYTGFDLKILIQSNATFNEFSYGTRMGPTQTEKHIKVDVTAHMLSWSTDVMSHPLIG